MCGVVMQVGSIVKSLKGHDAGRVYLVTAVINADFVLLVDGKYRKLAYPKQKRTKHVIVLSEESNLPEKLKNSDVKKVCKSYLED